MNENQSETDFSSEEVERFKNKLQLATKVARDAIHELKIPENAPADFQGKKKRWNIYYQNAGDNITLSIELNPYMTIGVVHLSLGHIVLEFLDDVEAMFSDSAAIELFEISKSEKDAKIYDRLLGLTVSFILYSPVVLYHSLYQAVGESVINNIKKIVEPLLRKDDESDEKTLNLLPNNELRDIVRRFPNSRFRLLNYVEIIDNEFREYRKSVYRNRQVFLTPERFENLYKEYDEIRITFGKIKKEYKTRKAAYELSNPTASPDGWENHWKNYLTAAFPAYSYTKMDLERRPSELAYRHLAKEFDYHPSRIEKKVILSRELANARRK